MQTFFVILHVVVCVGLIGVVLVQSSKGGGLAGAFGGGGGLPQQMFGSRAVTTALNKITIYLAVAFFVTSAVLFVINANIAAPRGSAVQQAIEEGTLAGEEVAPLPTGEVFDTPAADEAKTSAPAAGEAATGAATDDVEQ